jgi:hypothetical protein
MKYTEQTIQLDPCNNGGFDVQTVNSQAEGELDG